MEIKPIYSIIDSIHQPAWMIREWKIIFLFSERLLIEIRKASGVKEWYEDPLVTDMYVDRLGICYNTIQQVYSVLGILPQVGDRLYDEETGMKVQERSFDGGLMTITFTLTL